ncbi:hypothetical protein G9A89_014181 [Geosiphon pyriformis]|nr:hypothetical protein G9A89_014181 [Geosiphon pyriformis]
MKPTSAFFQKGAVTSKEAVELFKEQSPQKFGGNFQSIIYLMREQYRVLAKLLATSTTTRIIIDNVIKYVGAFWDEPEAAVRLELGITLRTIRHNTNNDREYHYANNYFIPSARHLKTRKRLYAEYLDIEPLNSSPLSDPFHIQYACIHKICTYTLEKKNFSSSKQATSESSSFRKRTKKTSRPDVYYCQIGALFDALSMSNVVNIHKIATEKRARGVAR